MILRTDIPVGYYQLDRTKEPADDNCLFRDTDGTWKSCCGMIHSVVLNRHLPIAKKKPVDPRVKPSLLCLPKELAGIR